MATKIVMEALSPTMEEGRLVEWKKSEGDSVTQGEVLAEVETDKAVMDLVARGSGVLLRQVVKAGATVPVAEVVGWIGQAGETIPDPGGGALGGAPSSRSAVSTAVAAATNVADGSGSAVAVGSAPPSMAAPVVVGGGGGRIKASPLARKMAATSGVDLTRITGSGPEGRIIKRDLENLAAAASTAPEAPGRAPQIAGTEFTDVPLSQMRKTIAKRLAQSIGPVPTFYLTSEIDMERAFEARAALNAATDDSGKISFNDIIIKATALALTQHPACNAWWQDNSIRQWHQVHIGMAVAVPDGLITPVIRNADLKSLRQISAAARDLARRARDRKLNPEEYSGSTFSISNLGMFDIHEFTAIINPPEAGILAIGRIAEVPTANDGRVEIRRRMMITMSCDHRVIDGATGAGFLRTLKLMLENPLGMVW